MKSRFIYRVLPASAVACLFVLILFFNGAPAGNGFKFPYKKEKLTEREAAAHLLDRFTYGATPGQVDDVVKVGLETWFIQQLQAGLPDDSLDTRLSAYDALKLTNEEVCRIYPPGFVIRNMAIKDSVISKDSVDKAVDKKSFNAQLLAYMQTKGYRSDQELYKQFINQHILRAAYTNNQLQEVLTEFWFNHFNVSFTKGESAPFIPAYERDVIRPNALGKFDKLVLASAKSPAMLYFLDNFTSVGPPAASQKAQPKPKAVDPAAGDPMMSMQAGGIPAAAPAAGTPKTVSGLNENYAREVMELHTLGVDGGYNQHDVTEAARVLTGWTIYPISETGYGSAMKGLVAKIGTQNLAQKGFVREGDFLFTPTRHDQGEKTVLGHVFPASKDPKAGYQEGVDLLEMLAHHPSTATFISRKLAVRFVSDNPSPALVAKMAKTFMESDGDIRQVLITMVSSRDFWNKKTLHGKTKSPFELAISSVRATKADIKDPYPLFNWVTRMGQKMYYYQAPTGFPDRGQYWINTGSLLNRMDFSLALVSEQIKGVNVNIGKLAPDAARWADAPQTLQAFCRVLLPERDPNALVAQLVPLLNDPAFVAKSSTAIMKSAPASADKPTVGAPGDMMVVSVSRDTTTDKSKTPPKPLATAQKANTTVLALAAGIIIGSPEFQRR